MEKQKEIKLFYAGGTISSMPNARGIREPGDADLFTQLKKHLSHLGERLPSTLFFCPAQMIHKGLSENMTRDAHQKITREIDTAIEGERAIGILLTIGTDSMIETAQQLKEKLQEKIQQQQITIAVTGGNEDITHPHTDALSNLQFAISSLSETANNGQLYIYFDGHKIDPDNAVMLPYDGQYMKLRDAKMSGYECFVENKKRNQTRIQELCRFAEEAKVALYYVNTFDREDHADFCHLVEVKKIRAIIFVLYHCGTANVEDEQLSVANLVEKLTKKGIVCFGTSQNGETVTFRKYITGEKLEKAGMISLGGMDYIVALIKTSKLLLRGKTNEELVDIMTST